MSDLKEIIKAIIKDEFAQSDCSNCENAKNGVGGLDLECDYCNIRNGSGWVMSDSAANKVAHKILGRIEEDGRYR